MSWGVSEIRDIVSDVVPRDCEYLLVHSNLGILGLPDSNDPAFETLQQLKETLPGSTSLLLPAFTYSFGMNEVFDPKSRSGINRMGALSQKAFELKFIRTRDPMFSLLSSTENELTSSGWEIGTSFGKGSAFSKIADAKTIILNIGTGAGSTILHELERRNQVSHRFDKMFEGFVREPETDLLTRVSWNSYVRSYEDEGFVADFTTLTRESVAAGVAKKLKIGKSFIWTYKLQEMSDFLFSKFREEPLYLTTKNRSLKF